MTFDRRHKRGFLAANECARAELKLYIEFEARTENIISEQAVFSCLLDSYFQALYGNRILRADINITLMRADCVARDCHCLENRVRVAFENGPVHKRAGVALVCIAAYIFCVIILIFSKLPFYARREARAASAAKPRSLDNIDDLLRIELGQTFDKSLISVASDILVYLLGIDNTAVAQSYAGLLLIEVGIGQCLYRFVAKRLFVIEQSFHKSALDNMLLYNLGNVVNAYAAVKSALGIDDYNRTYRAQTEAAGAYNKYVVLKIFLLNLLLESLADFSAVI